MWLSQRHVPIRIPHEKKNSLGAENLNEYSEIKDELLEWLVDRAGVLTPEAAQRIMGHLREDNATGPDLVPTRIIACLGKKNQVFDPVRT